jgi:hypothetical protein
MSESFTGVAVSKIQSNSSDHGRVTLPGANGSDISHNFPVEQHSVDRLHELGPAARGVSLFCFTSSGVLNKGRQSK